MEDPHPRASPATARRPHLGVNAIYRMGRVLAALETYAGDARRGPRPTRSSGPPSLSVGRIEGGQSVNVVPDWCEIEVDRRLIPGEDAGADASSRSRGVPAPSVCGGLDGIEFGQPWVHMPPLSPRARPTGSSRSASAIAAATGRRPDVIGVPFGTDAGPLSAAGTALPRLRPRRHRPGPHQGRMDRARPGPPGRRGLLPDRPDPGPRLGRLTKVGRNHLQLGTSGIRRPATRRPLEEYFRYGEETPDQLEELIACGSSLQILPYRKRILRRCGVRGSTGPWIFGVGGIGRERGAKSSTCSASGTLFRIRCSQFSFRLLIAQLLLGFPVGGEASEATDERSVGIRRGPYFQAWAFPSISVAIWRSSERMAGGQVGMLPEFEDGEVGASLDEEQPLRFGHLRRLHV